MDVTVMRIGGRWTEGAGFSHTEVFLTKTTSQTSSISGQFQETRNLILKHQVQFIAEIEQRKSS